MSVSYRLLATHRRGPVEYVTLNRPEVRNALNEVLIDELRQWATAVAADDGVRVAVLAGSGPVFCAGADVDWLARTASQSREENLRDASAAAHLYLALDRCPKPLVARVHGAAMGGGAGLAAVCDVAVAADSTRFGFTEVKLGVVPAVISPFVVSRIGVSAARELFLTGMRFTAARAREIGLVHAVVPEPDLDAAVEGYVAELLGAAPGAVATAKWLLSRVAAVEPESLLELTTETLAARRSSAEGQEGLRAFLERRRPGWHVPPHSDR